MTTSSGIWGWRGCESVGWAPWEGWRCLRRAGTEGKERKALRKGGDSHRSHLLPLLFSVLCSLPAREEPAETRDRRRAAERQLHGQRSLHEALVADLCSTSQAGHFPAGMLAAHGCVLEDTLLAKEGSGTEVSKCFLFLEGSLSKKKKKKIVLRNGLENSLVDLYFAWVRSVMGRGKRSK